MNLSEIITWSSRIIAGKESNLKSMTLKEREKYQEKLNWIEAFKEPLKEWEEMMAVVKTTEKFIREEGISLKAGTILSDKAEMNPSSSKGKKSEMSCLNLFNYNLLK